jgi:putative nucleotidyltransferase with HDIG domain
MAYAHAHPLPWDRFTAVLATLRRTLHTWSRGGVFVLALDDLGALRSRLGIDGLEALTDALEARAERARPDQGWCARLGDGRLLIVASGVGDPRQAEEIAEALAACADPPLQVGAETIAAEVTVGLALFPRHSRDPRSLIRMADLAAIKARDLPAPAPEVSEAAPPPGPAPRQPPKEAPLPLLPVVMARLACARRDTPDLDLQIEALAAADPTLAARLIALSSKRWPVDSPEVPTIDELIARVGAWPLVAAIQENVSSGVFLPTPEVARGLWLHSLQTAHGAALIARHVAGVEGEEEAYLAGLLHDLGRFLSLQRRTDEVVELERAGWESPAHLSALERQLMAFDHAIEGGEAARAWSLPRELCEVIARHHDDDLTGCPPLCAVVRLADALSGAIMGNPGAGPADRQDAVLQALDPAWGPPLCPASTLADLWPEIERRSLSSARSVGLLF